jgi:transcriptional regulator with XRE-family HTH domain
MSRNASQKHHPSSDIGRRIRKYRRERGLNLSQLADRARISKSYLWSLENENVDARPSGESLYALAEALGVTMSDLLGRKLLVAEKPDSIPASLREFARDNDLPESDVRMLATIRFRGEEPRTKERWKYIYDAIRSSELFDREGKR